jgi:hypothetical protein
MAMSAQRGEPFLFYIAPSVILRAIPLAYVAVVLLGVAYIPLMVGLARLSNGFRNYPALWWLVLLLAASVALMLWLAFPPRETQARLDVRYDSLSFIPSQRDQSFFAKQPVKAAVTAQSREILFCLSFFEGLPEGTRLIVCGAHEPERKINVRFSYILDAQDCQSIAAGITSNCTKSKYCERLGDCDDRSGAFR